MAGDRRIGVAIVVALCALGPVVPAASAASELVSDDFSPAPLDTTRWQVVDPVGDGSVIATGTQLRLTVPAGTSHDPWGVNRALRVVQPVTAPSFEIETRFGSAPVAAKQMQGLVVEADAGNWLRFDLLHNGTARRAFAASTTSGVTTMRHNTAVPAGGDAMWLRVRRDGDSWSASWSLDGVTFTRYASFSHRLAVARAGPFVANHATPTSATPAFTSVVDYVFDRAHPVEPEDPTEQPPPDEDPPSIHGVAVTPTVTSAVVAWSTDEVTTGEVELVPGSGTGRVVRSIAVPSSSHRVELAPLPCETAYTARVRAADAAGNVAVSDPAPFTTGPCPGPDQTPPVIAAVAIRPQRTAAVVAWTTDEPATSVVRYRRRGASAAAVASSDGPSTEHEVTLPQLECHTGYDVEVESADADGNTATGPPSDFLTGYCRTPPLRSDDFSGTALVPAWAVVDPAADARVSLDDRRLALAVPGGAAHDPGGAVDRSLRVVQDVSDGDFDVEVKLESPFTAEGQLQGLVVESGASARLRFELQRTGTSGRLVVIGHRPGSVRTWVSASLPAGGAPVWLRVRHWGRNWQASWSSDGRSWNTTPSFAQRMAITAIGPYAGTVGAPAPPFTALVDYVFERTRPVVPEDGPPDATAPVVTAVAAAPFVDGAWVTWSTDEPASSRVEYGPSPDLGSYARTPATTRQHAVTLTGLPCGATQHYRVVSVDDRGNEAASAVRALVTEPCGNRAVVFERDVVDADAARPHTKALGDLDGDGVLDAAYGSYTGNGGLFWRAGPHWAVRHEIRASGLHWEDMQTADVDGDTDVDVVAGTGAGGLRWYANPLHGGGDPAAAVWAEHVVNRVTTHDIELADFDDDGRVDIATERGLYVRTATGGWQLVGRTAIDRSPVDSGTGVGDVDGDGFVDVVAAGPRAPYPVTWFRNPRGSGGAITSRWAAHAIGAAPGDGPWRGAFVVTDVNGDGRSDVAAAALAEHTSGLRWLEGPPDPTSGAWREHVVDSTATALHTFEALDVDGDGGTDLVVAEQEQSPEDRVAVFYGRDGGRRWELDVLATTGGHNLKVGDVEGDGDVDVLVANHGHFGVATPIELFRATAGKAVPGHPVALPPATEAAGAAALVSAAVAPAPAPAAATAHPAATGLQALWRRSATANGNRSVERRDAAGLGAAVSRRPARTRR